MYDPLLVQARRVERNAVVVTVCVIFLAVSAALFRVWIVLYAYADCGEGCIGSSSLVQSIMGLIAADFIVTSIFLLACSYIRMRARAVIRQFTPAPWPMPYPAPGTPPSPPPG